MCSVCLLVCLFVCFYCTIYVLAHVEDYSASPSHTENREKLYCLKCCCCCCCCCCCFLGFFNLFFFWFCFKQSLLWTNLHRSIHVLYCILKRNKFLTCTIHSHWVDYPLPDIESHLVLLHNKENQKRFCLERTQGVIYACGLCVLCITIIVFVCLFCFLLCFIFVFF